MENMGNDPALMDYLKKREENEKTEAIMTGATPLLVGFLAGNMGDAYGIASKGLIALNERRAKKEDHLMDYLKKKGGESSQLYRMITPEGPRYGTREQALGAEPAIDSPIITGRKEAAKLAEQEKSPLKTTRVIMDPIKGIPTTVNVMTGEENKPIFKPQTENIHPKFQKDVETVVKDLGPLVRPDIEKVKNARSGLNLSTKKGIMPAQVALNQVIKITESRATDEDRAFVTKQLNLWERAKEFVQQQKDPVLVKRKLDEMKTIFNTISDVTSSTINRTINSAVEGVVERDAQGNVLPNQKEYALRKFSIFSPSNVPSPAPEKKERRRNKYSDMSTEELKKLVEQGRKEFGEK